jgi:mono/diheme cytochrome c family protein
MNRVTGNLFIALGLITVQTTLTSSLAQTAVPPVIGGLQQHSDIEPLLAGGILLSELNCTACHSSNKKWLSFKGAPDLSGTGNRMIEDHLKEFITDPAGTKPGTTMPNLLDHLSEAERNQTAKALAHYLTSNGSGSVSNQNTASDSVERGRVLYHTVGCVACHSPENPIEGSVPLGSLESKYTLSGLASFLRNPLLTRPSGRMPDLNLNHEEAADLAGYLLRNQTRQVSPFILDVQLAEQGRILFNKHGCITCHQNNSGGEANQSIALKNLRENEGCLSNRKGNWPRYALSNEQKSDIIEVLQNINLRLNEEQEIQTTLTKFNCIACHRRNSYGGIAESRNEYFSSQDPNLGEQGRLPPTLTGVGVKLKPAWLRQILVQGAPGRNYLNTRMPQFPASHLERLMVLIDQTDQLPSVDPISFAKINDAKRAGRDLTGTDGLNCLACHTFKGKRTGAMGALDLTVMAQRLQRDWFHQYLLQPQQFSPNTLMPTYWINGQSQKPEILEGRTNDQIEALWLYLSEGYSAGEPRGLRREPMKLVSTNSEAVMLRRSYRGIGKRGIGVGYPGEVNLVYNAEQLCLAMIWRGEFADPAGVWRSQGHGTVRPLSRNPISFPQMPELAFLDRPNADWPTVQGRSEHYQFNGYTLDEQRRPTFRYHYLNVQVDDNFVETLNPESGTHFLRRTLVFKSISPQKTLVFRAAENAEIIAKNSNRFQIGNNLRITISKEFPAQIINLKNSRQLRVPIHSNSEETSMILDYNWEADRK